MPRLPLFLPLLQLLLALGACDASAAPPRRALVLFVDGEARAELAPADLERPLDLFETLGLAPAEAVWVEIRGDGERALKVKDPAERYPKRILAAFPTDTGVGVGWVDPVLGGLPAQLAGLPPVSFEQADEVHVRVTRVEEPAERASAPTLHVDTSAGLALELEPAALEGFPRRTPREVMGRGEGSQKLAMTFLGDVLAASIPVEEVERVILHTAAGEALELDGACLRLPAPRAVLLKVNRRGEWRFKVYESAQGGVESSANLRGVTRVEVRLRGG
jgi:hypothetical protein